MSELYKRYGVIGIFNLVINVIYTKLLYSGARLIRRPFDIRGRKYIKLGNGFTSGRYCRFEAYPQDDDNNIVITFGSNCQVNDSVHIVGRKKVKIGNDVLIASRVFITDLNHGNYSGEQQSHPEEISDKRVLNSKDVVIGDNVWIGEGVSILPGVEIGRCTIIGANSVVTKSVPDYCIVGGNPAIILKKFDFEKKEWVSTK
ncbi:acetyltransferase [Limnobaculum zhutongyuii]|uniref:Acetyltransferase n=2 Tax=Limnobaculum zhutongyuii TaxID=2498113 RepID=A0A411WS69_9GAMM|nr:acetyltransferase [Limnobaculum zhutongyuii]QBH98835.1 acetyltransferase [Limnobaculum zhutongyuii]TQS88211.1 acetyltransferase [Limnobaculum zhutongyuii]